MNNSSLLLVAVLLCISTFTLSAQSFYLNEYFFNEGDVISVQLDKNLKLETGFCLFYSESTNDIEYIFVGDSKSPKVDGFSSEQISIRFSHKPGKENDGVLHVKEGGRFTALLSVIKEGKPSILNQVGFHKYDTKQRIKERAKMNPTYSKVKKEKYEGQTSIVSFANEVPFISESNKIILSAQTSEEVERFEKTYGEFVKVVSNLELEGTEQFILYDIKNYRSDLDYLAQALDLTKGKLDFSNQQDLASLDFIYNATLHGFSVSLNGMVFQNSEFKSESTAVANFTGDVIGNSFDEAIYDIPDLWELMAIYDFDEETIHPGIVDLGFVDSYDDVTEENLEDRQLSVSFSGSTGPSTLASGRGDHGIGVQSILAGQINNGGLSAGIAGQVAAPVTCRLPTGPSFIFQLAQGLNITRAEDVSLINVSFSYPCAIALDIGLSFNYCDPLQASAFCASLSAIANGAAISICIATSWIPIAGAIACAASAASVAATTISCITTATAINANTAILRAVVSDVIDDGIPLIVSAGNLSDIRNFGGDFDFVVEIDEQNATIEEWNLMPARLNGVIAVGAVDDVSSTGGAMNPTWNIENTQVHGNLEIWAPSPSSASLLDNTGGFRTSTFGGSSGAAAYISGLITLAQVIDPRLNPANPALTNNQRNAIIPTIRNLIMTTAYPRTAAELNFTDNFVDRLINPHAFIEAVMDRANIRKMQDFGYRSLREENPTEPDDDIRANAFVLDHNNGMRLNRMSEILFVPGLNGAADEIDVDHIRVNMPASLRTNLYDCTLQLTYPTELGDLQLAGRFIDGAETRTFESGFETTKEYVIRNLFNRSSNVFRVEGVEATDDNFYRITSSIESFPESIAADNFEPNNNRSRAFDTQYQSNVDYRYIYNNNIGKHTLGNINFHHAYDRDFFILENVNPSLSAGEAYKYRLASGTEDLDISITALTRGFPDELIPLSGIGSFLENNEPYIVRGPYDLLFEVSPKVPGSYVEYEIILEIENVADPYYAVVPWDDSFDWLEDLLKQDLLDQGDEPGFGFPYCLSCPPLKVVNNIDVTKTSELLSKVNSNNILPPGIIDIRSANITRTQTLVFDYDEKEGDMYYIKSDKKKFTRISPGNAVCLKKGSYRFAFSRKKGIDLKRFTYSVRTKSSIKSQ